MNRLPHGGGLWDKGLGSGAVEGLLCRTPPHTVLGAGGQVEGIQESPSQEYSEGSVLLPEGRWAGTDLGPHAKGSPGRAQRIRSGAMSTTVSLMPSSELGIQKVLTGCTGLDGGQIEAECFSLNGPQPTFFGPSFFSIPGQTIAGPVVFLVIRISIFR